MRLLVASIRLFFASLLLAFLLASPARASDDLGFPRVAAVPDASAVHVEVPPIVVAQHPAAAPINLAAAAIAEAAKVVAAPKIDPVALGNGLLAADVAIKNALDASGIPVDWWARHPDVRIARDVLFVLLALAGTGAIIYGQVRAASVPPTP